MPEPKHFCSAPLPLFQLMELPLASPSYSCISKRAKTVNIHYRLPSKGLVAHLVIDATGLKLFGEGEWKQRLKAETAMSRYKQLISPKLGLRDCNGQMVEALAGVKVMNKILGLGMPIRQVS